MSGKDGVIRLDDEIVENYYIQSAVKWEYKCVKHQFMSDVENELNQHGKEGWEHYQTIHINNKEYHFFKRPLTPTI